MQPIKIRVKEIVDFGTIVSIVGIDMVSKLPVMVHVDHRPFQAIWENWRLQGFTKSTVFDAEQLTLDLGLNPTDE